MVTSVRFSGTRQTTNWGLMRQAMPIISSVTAIFQIHPGLDGLAQYLHVAVGDVAAIFAQVQL